MCLTQDLQRQRSTDSAHSYGASALHLTFSKTNSAVLLAPSLWLMHLPSATQTIQLQPAPYGGLSHLFVCQHRSKARRKSPLAIRHLLPSCARHVLPVVFREVRAQLNLTNLQQTEYPQILYPKRLPCPVDHATRELGSFIATAVLEMLLLNKRNASKVDLLWEPSV